MKLFESAGRTSALAKAGFIRASIALREPLLLTGNMTVVIAFDAAPTKAEDIFSKFF